MRFPVVVTQEELGYVATEISSGVASQGESVEEALAMLREALELYYEVFRRCSYGNCTKSQQGYIYRYTSEHHQTIGNVC